MNFREPMAAMFTENSFVISKGYAGTWTLWTSFLYPWYQKPKA